MSWRRVITVLLFDLRHAALRPRGLLFLVPFLLLWVPILRSWDRDVAAWFRSQDALVLAAQLFDVEVARSLFLEHPPVLSAFLLVALTSTPFFVILATHDQFASDLGGGFLRYLVTRCSRFEIFVGRYLAALVFITAAYWVMAVVTAVISLLTDARPLGEVAIYALQIMLTLLLYLAPLVAFMSIISALCSTAIGALLLGLSAYAGILIFAWMGNGLFKGQAPFSWLLPSALKEYLFGVDPVMSSLAVAALPLYVLAYGWIGWRVFRARNF